MFSPRELLVLEFIAINSPKEGFIGCVKDTFVYLTLQNNSDFLFAIIPERKLTKKDFETFKFIFTNKFVWENGNGKTWYTKVSINYPAKKWGLSKFCILLENILFYYDSKSHNKNFTGNDVYEFIIDNLVYHNILTNDNKYSLETYTNSYSSQTLEKASSHLNIFNLVTEILSVFPRN